MEKQKRDYQIQTEDAFFSELDSGLKSGMIVLATGLGKTFVKKMELMVPFFLRYNLKWCIIHYLTIIHSTQKH